MFTTTKLTPARWNNTGGDVQVHLVPAGTVLLERGDYPWQGHFQVTTPTCGLGIYHGSWTHTPENTAPLKRCDHCFPGDEEFVLALCTNDDCPTVIYKWNLPGNPCPTCKEHSGVSYGRATNRSHLTISVDKEL